MLTLRVVLHMAVFAASFLIAMLGPGVGLILNSAAGTLLSLVVHVRDRPQGVGVPAQKPDAVQA